MVVFMTRSERIMSRRFSSFSSFEFRCCCLVYTQSSSSNSSNNVFSRLISVSPLSSSHRFPKLLSCLPFIMWALLFFNIFTFSMRDVIFSSAVSRDILMLPSTVSLSREDSSSLSNALFILSSSSIATSRCAFSLSGIAGLRIDSLSGDALTLVFDACFSRYECLSLSYSFFVLSYSSIAAFSCTSSVERLIIPSLTFDALDSILLLAFVTPINVVTAFSCTSSLE
mmetsp:Transcript_15196/g.19038  ORF Transcript_15196/g.19038 Transcript_15196/m.19038 type:complete len:226 (+) Transcript_15196:582-1259(+)